MTDTVLINNIEFRLNRPWKYIARDVLQRIEAIGEYKHGEIRLDSNSSLKEVVKACFHLEEQAQQQLDMIRGK